VTSGAGKKKQKNWPRDVVLSLPPEIDLRIVAWVNRLRGEGVPISTLMLRALETATSADITIFTASPTWQSRFRKWHPLPMRARTRQGQIRPEDGAARAVEFAIKVREKMAEQGVTVVYNAKQTGTLYVLI
jgi:hypothetical protein